jgi:transcriptional regulator with XRE-family HTH domain
MEDERRRPGRPPTGGRQANRIAVDRLSLWRAWKHWGQGELAQKADLSRTTVSMLENGLARANPVTVYKLAQALGISRKQLLEEDPPEAWLIQPGEEDAAETEEGQKEGRAVA